MFLAGLGWPPAIVHLACHCAKLRQIDAVRGTLAHLEDLAYYVQKIGVSGFRLYRYQQATA